MELQLKDLETVEKRLEKVSRAARTGNKEAIKEKEVLDKLQQGLAAATSVRALSISDDDRKAMSRPCNS